MTFVGAGMIKIIKNACPGFFVNSGMTRNATFAAWFVSLYLLTYIILLYQDNHTLRQIAIIMLFLSPMLLAWLAYTVIRFGKFTGRELQEGEEFGYGDRPSGHR